MGLPLAGVYAEVTGNVVGVDVDESVAETVDSGGCHVDGEPDLAELVEERVSEGGLSATHEPTAAAACDETSTSSSSRRCSLTTTSPTWRHFGRQSSRSVRD